MGEFFSGIDVIRNTQKVFLIALKSQYNKRGIPMFRISTSNAKRKSLIKGLLLISLSVYLPSVSMAKPAETRLSTLENCQFLGKVEGSSGYGRKYDWIRPAKSSALSRAENLGGSHIVWERMDRVGVYNGHAVARVFSCS